MRERNIAQALRGAFNVTRGRAKYATIRERITESARIDGIHLCQLMAAMVIASVGLNTNSTEAVIGAMLICPLMGSVLAIACGIASMDMRMVHHALSGLLLQCGICLVTSTLYFLVSPLSAQTSELLTNASATIWDVLIALVGGFAGALGLSRRQEPSTLVAGVAVATALMPPLCAVGYGIANREALIALAALYEFSVNVVFIAFGATVVLVLLRMPFVGDLDGDGRETPEERAEAAREAPMLRRRMLAGLLVFAIPCVYFSVQMVQRSVEQSGTTFEVVDTYDTRQLTEELAVVCPGFVDYRVGVEDSFDTAQGVLRQRVVATVTTASELAPAERREVEDLVRLHVSDLDEVAFEVKP